MDLGIFAYEKRKNGICILRCYGSSGSVIVPELLDGLPVTELSEYAFAAVKEEEPENNSGFPCICGDRLEELYLPRTIQRMGRYVFYNCFSFRKFSFYSNLAYMGAGAFTGCGNLSCLEMYRLAGVSCLREILQDLKQRVTVDICRACGEQEAGEKPKEESIGLKMGEDAKGGRGLVCRLVYPEFFEEAVENTPARIISTQTHGMGIQYRNAFRNTQVIFEEYDRLFQMGKYNIELITGIEMVIARMRYPWELHESARTEYAGWLAGHLEEASGYLLEEEKMEELRWLAEDFISLPAQMEVILDVAKRKNLPEAVSILMDVRRRRFPVRKKKFCL